jgi:hypothetical protein
VTRLLAQARTAVTRNDWAKVRELGTRAAALQTSLDAEQEVLALAASVYGAPAVALDPLSPGLARFTKRWSAAAQAQSDGEPAGLLSVASVAANLRATASTAARAFEQLQRQPRATLTRVRLRRESDDRVRTDSGRTLREGDPFSGEPGRAGAARRQRACARTAHLGARQAANGLRNPLYGPPEARAAFEQSIALLEQLERAGQATSAFTSSKTAASRR